MEYLMRPPSWAPDAMIDLKIFETHFENFFFLLNELYSISKPPQQVQDDVQFLIIETYAQNLVRIKNPLVLWRIQKYLPKNDLKLEENKNNNPHKNHNCPEDS
jgi:hypothetical protein